MESILSDSPLFGGKTPEFRTVEWSDVIMGDKLGEGGFCLVHACALKDAPLDESCAIKSLKPELAANKKNFVHGAEDLATEACFLGKLDHPNIVKLRAVTAGSVESTVSNSGTSDKGFFIVIDRLVETLEQKIHRWQSQIDDSPHSMFYRMSREYKDKQKVMLLERLEVALDLSNVMTYLHSLNVVFRDLKPDNCGFTRDGTLKLFDFGLAKEEKPSMRDEDGRYRMTGHTGSRRYMAREGKQKSVIRCLQCRISTCILRNSTLIIDHSWVPVAKDESYDKSVDVYSFGILLWEICSLEKPFEGYCSKKHMVNVINGGERPKMDHHHVAHWPASLQLLMKSCWSSEPKNRPSFEFVKSTLENVMEELTVQSDRTRAISTGSHESKPSAQKSPILSGIKAPQRQGLRVRSLGLKRAPP